VKLKISKKGLSAGDICEVTQDDRDQSPYKLKKLGTSSDKSWFEEGDVDKVQRGGSGDSGSGGGYSIGEKVEMKDNGKSWKTGYVRNLHPLKVSFESDGNSGDGYGWDEVRKVGGAFSIGEKVERRDGSKAWETGFVTSVSPLKVTFSTTPTDDGKGYGWDEVRKLGGAASPPSPAAAAGDGFAIGTIVTSTISHTGNSGFIKPGSHGIVKKLTGSSGDTTRINVDFHTQKNINIKRTQVKIAATEAAAQAQRVVRPCDALPLHARPLLILPVHSQAHGGIRVSQMPSGKSKYNGLYRPDGALQYTAGTGKYLLYHPKDDKWHVGLHAFDPEKPDCFLRTKSTTPAMRPVPIGLKTWQVWSNSRWSDASVRFEEVT
jgi:hypothetical protein